MFVYQKCQALNSLHQHFFLPDHVWSIDQHLSHNNCTVENTAKSLQFFDTLITPEDGMQTYASEVYQPVCLRSSDLILDGKSKRFPVILKQRE